MNKINLENQDLKTIIHALEYIVDDLKMQKEKGFDPPILSNGESLLDDALRTKKKMELQFPIIPKENIFPSDNDQIEVKETSEKVTQGEKKIVPDIVKRIVDFINFWNNPNRETGEYKSIEEFQLQIYSVSTDFAFKWWVSRQDLLEVSKFIGESVSDNKLTLSIGNFTVELELQNNHG